MHGRNITAPHPPDKSAFAPSVSDEPFPNTISQPIEKPFNVILKASVLSDVKAKNLVTYLGGFVDGEEFREFAISAYLRHLHEHEKTEKLREEARLLEAAFLSKCAEREKPPRKGVMAPVSASDWTWEELEHLKIQFANQGLSKVFPKSTDLSGNSDLSFPSPPVPTHTHFLEAARPVLLSWTLIGQSTQLD